MSDEQQRLDPVQSVLAFKEHVMDIHDALVGYKTELKHDEKGMPYLESGPDPDATPICTLEGGKYLVHHSFARYLSYIISSKISEGAMPVQEQLDIMH